MKRFLLSSLSSIPHEAGNRFLRPTSTLNSTHARITTQSQSLSTREKVCVSSGQSIIAPGPSFSLIQLLARCSVNRKSFGCAPGRVLAGVSISAYPGSRGEPHGPSRSLPRPGDFPAARADATRQEQGEIVRVVIATVLAAAMISLKNLVYFEGARKAEEGREMKPVEGTGIDILLSRNDTQRAATTICVCYRNGWNSRVLTNCDDFVLGFYARRISINAICSCWSRRAGCQDMLGTCHGRKNHGKE